MPRGLSMNLSTLVLIALALVATGVAYWKDPGLPMLGAKNGLSMVWFVLPRLIPALILAGMLQVIIPQETVAQYFGQRSGIGAILMASAAGVLTPGGPMVSVPLLVVLANSGMALGPLVFALLHALLTRTRWGTLVRAATEDREMTAALGVNQRWLFTGIFALGALLAGAGGALAVPREPASLAVDLAAISDAFVVVVVGGLGSIPGAFLAALLIGEVKAFCIGFGYSEITLVVEFIVMAVVLVLRPWGLLGKPLLAYRGAQAAEPPLGRIDRKAALALACLLALLAALPLVRIEKIPPACSRPVFELCQKSPHIRQV